MLGYKLYADDKLVSLLKTGDHAAFTEIYIRYSGTLYQHTYHLLKNRNDVKDIVQDIFTTLWNNRLDLLINTNLAGYLYVAARNRVIKVISHQQVETKYLYVLQATIKEGSLATDYLIRERQLTEIIEAEINELPVKMRQY